MLLLLLFLELPTVLNQPMSGAITESTAVIKARVLCRETQVDSMVIYYGLTDVYDATSDTAVAASNMFLSLILHDLVPDTVYHYKAKVWNSTDSVRTDDKTFRTQDTSGTFSFIVLGDQKYDVNAWNVFNAVFDSLLGQIKLESGVDFMVTTGDMVEIEGHAERDSGAWECWHDHVDTMIIDKQIVLTMGNHDFSQESMTKEAMDSSVAECRRAFPGYNEESYQFFRWGKCGFIVLNTFWRMGNFIKCNIDSAQMTWLRDLCYDTIPGNFTWTFAFGHHKIADTSASMDNWQEDPLYGGSVPGQLDSIKDFFDSANVHIYCSGHTHQYKDIGKQNGTHYFVIGGGGGTLTTLKGGIGVNHYCRFDVYPDSMRMNIRREAGIDLYTHLITKEEYINKTYWRGVKLRGVE